MAHLTNDQLAFLKSQHVSLSLVLDGSSLSKKDRDALMDETGLKFYYGGAPCKAGGHTLRTKAGHCIQCDTSKIAYQLRSSASGYVYLAHSERNNFVKVGFSEVDPYSRVTWLQTSGYGGVNDWVVVKSQRISQGAGKCEFDIHSALEKWRRPVVYRKHNADVECREIFACPLAAAQETYDKIVRSFQ
jgi:hypothetical protein